MADRAVPNLPSRDFSVTAEFYGRFGFVQTYRDESWLVLRRATIQLEFFPHPELDPRASSFMCSIRVTDVDELYSAIHAAGVSEESTTLPRLTPISRRHWGQRVGYLNDPDGTQLHLIEDSDPE